MGYWRKHAPLHCHIVDDLRGRTWTTAGRFRCQRKTFWRLRMCYARKALPKDEDCEGFFFGSPDMWSEDREAGAEACGNV
jgi:hypothetical protein